MNVKMPIILPFTIALFVSGVYCPRTVQEFPTWYPLTSCVSKDMVFKWPNSFFELFCSEEYPRDCELIENFSGERKQFVFERTNVEFISMENKKLTMKIYLDRDTDIEWNITCEFLYLTQARQFYSLMTRNRHFHLTFFSKADYLKTSDGTVLAERPDLFLDGFGRDVTIVVKNDKGDGVLIIPKDAIAHIIHSEFTQIDLYTDITGGQRQIYKFGFSTLLKASAWNQLLNKLSQLTPATQTGICRRPFRDSAVDTFFLEIRQLIPQ